MLPGRNEGTPTHVTSQCIWLLLLSVPSGKGWLLLLPTSCSPLLLQTGTAPGLCWASNRRSEGDRHAGVMGRAGSTASSHLCSLTAGAAFQQRLFAPNSCAKSSYLLDHWHPLESKESEGLIANSAGSQILGCVSQFKFN